MKLSTSDYKKILKFYKVSIPKKSKNIKKKADKIIAKKFCSCIKKVQQKFKKEGIAIGICTKSVITRKGYKRGKFRCKKRRTVKLQKGGGGCLSRRCRRDSPDNMEELIMTGQRNALTSSQEEEFQAGERMRAAQELRTALTGAKLRQRHFPSTPKSKRTQGGKRRRKTRKKRGGLPTIKDIKYDSTWVNNDTKKRYKISNPYPGMEYNDNDGKYIVLVRDPIADPDPNEKKMYKYTKSKDFFDNFSQARDVWNGGRKKKTRKKRGGTANLCKLFHERNLTFDTTISDDEREVLDKYCKVHGDTNVEPNDDNKCEVTTGICWLPTNIAPLPLIRSNRQGNNQAMTTQLNQSFSSTHGGAGKRKYPEGSQDNPSSSKQTVALKESEERRKLAQVVLTKWAELQNEWNNIWNNPQQQIPDNYREEDFDMLDYKYQRLFDKVKELEEKYRELAKKHKPGTPAYQNTIGLADENLDAMNIIIVRRSMLRLVIKHIVEADRQEGGKRRRKRGGMDNNKTKKSRNRLRRALGKIKVIKEDFVNTKKSSPFTGLSIDIPNELNPRVSPITIPVTSPITTPVTSPITTMDNLIDSMKNTKITRGGKRKKKTRRKKTRRKKGSCKFNCFVKKKTLGEETKATLQKHRAFNEQPKHIKAEIEKTQTLRKGYDNYKHFDNMRMETGNTKLTRRSPSPTWDSTTQGHEEWEPLLEFENKLVNLAKQGKGGKRRKKRR